MHLITDPRCTQYHSQGHPERPSRIQTSVQKLKSQSEIPITWEKPDPVSDEVLLRAHTADHLTRLKKSEDFDGDTPFHSGIDEIAQLAVGASLASLRIGQDRKPVFSLMRPPGHHATQDRAMGFCYLNSMAITILEALSSGTEKAVVFDFDVHHGNGTEAILLNKPGCMYISIHQYPGYPGTGTRHQGNCRNFTAPPGSSREAYREELKKGLEELHKFNPDLIGVSAGFDAYTKDPLSQQQLEAEDFHWLGEQLSGFKKPMFSLLEGGYSDDLPDLILAYLKGL